VLVVPVSGFTREYVASFHIEGQSLHARVANRFESSLDVIEGPCEPDAFVGDIVFGGYLVGARHWRLVEHPARHYWFDIKDLQIAAISSEELIAKLNARFGQDQEFIQTLLH
jgi:hypothetical protein